MMRLQLPRFFSAMLLVALVSVAFSQEPPARKQQSLRPAIAEILKQMKASLPVGVEVGYFDGGWHGLDKDVPPPSELLKQAGSAVERNMVATLNGSQFFDPEQEVTLTVFPAFRPSNVRWVIYQFLANDPREPLPTFIVSVPWGMSVGEMITPFRIRYAQKHFGLGRGVVNVSFYGDNFVHLDSLRCVFYSGFAPDREEGAPAIQSATGEDREMTVTGEGFGVGPIIILRRGNFFLSYDAIASRGNDYFLGIHTFTFSRKGTVLYFDVTVIDFYGLVTTKQAFARYVR